MARCSSSPLLPLVIASVVQFQLAIAFAPPCTQLTIKSCPIRGYFRSRHQIALASLHPSNKIKTNQLTTALSNTNSDTAEEEDDDEESKKQRVRQEVYWAKQRALAAEMSAKSDAALKKEQQEKFAKRRLALTSDTLYFSILIASALWLFSSNPFVSLSYLFGALSGTAYSYGLGKYVETIGGSIDDAEAEGAGIGQARFAFLILLFVVVGKFRDQGLLEIPSIMGFFTYQLASLSQGLREIDD